MSSKENQKGFTLAELLIYLVVLSMATLLIAATFVSLNRGQGLAESQGEVNSNTRFAIEKISQDIKSASAVSTPATTATPSNTLIITAGPTITYCIVAGSLRREAVDPSCTSSSPIITGSNVVVDSITFTKFENINTVLAKTLTSIEISITISHANPSPERKFTQTKKTTVFLP